MKQVGAFFVPIITLLIAQVIAVDLGCLRFHGKKLWLILIVELILQVMLNVSIILIFGLQVYAKFIFVTMDLPAILVFLYISKRRDFSTIYTILCTIYASLSITFTAIWIVDFLDGGYNLYNFIRIILFVLTMFIVHYFIREKYQLIQREMDKGWGMFCILPMICIAVLYYQYYRHGFENKNFMSLLYSSSIILIMMIIFFIFFYVFYQIHERNLLREQQRILALQSKAQWEMFEYQKEATDKANRKWHDFRFHTNNLIELLEEGDVDLALTYLKEQQILDIPENIEYCQHASVNSILLLWAGRIQKAGISLEIKTQIPQELNIDPMELSALFANALENAYYGCECLPEGHAKYIYVEADYMENRLTVMIRNSCRNDIVFHDNLPVSQSEGGGNGTRSIQYIARRHKGTAFFDAGEDQFTFRTVLYV